MKEYKPSIASRESEELYSILSNYEDWEQEAVVQAKDELEKRGETREKQVELTKKSILAREKSEQELAEESYTKREMLAYILTFAIGLKFGGFGILGEYDDRKIRKNKQRTLLIIGGITFWGLLVYIIAII